MLMDDETWFEEPVEDVWDRHQFVQREKRARTIESRIPRIAPLVVSVILVTLVTVLEFAS